MGASLAAFGGSSKIIVPPMVRSPLPPFPGSLVPYRTELPWTPPQGRDFYRGDAWGVTMPGAPRVPGCWDRHPERIFSWLLDRYPEDFRHEYLTAYAARQYTHFMLSVGDFNAPWSLTTLVDMCRLVKRYVPYVCVTLGTKDAAAPGFRADKQTWLNYVDPLLDALLPVVDEVVPGWEWNLWNRTGGEGMYDVLKHIGARAHAVGVGCWHHFSTEATSWQDDGDLRFKWWQTLGDDVDGLNYQADGAWPPWLLQARMVDTLWFFGTSGNRWKMRLWEDCAYMMDSDHPDEDDANLRGYLACCTVDNVRGSDAKVWGYGNGGRCPDGSRL